MKKGPNGPSLNLSSLSEAMVEAQEHDSDAALVAQARAGSKAAFESLVRRHYRTAFAVALAICASRADAEDICQEAFIKSLERLDSCRTPDRFGAWLSEIVRNRALNHLEHARVRRAEPIHDIEIGQDTVTPETNYRRRELGRHLETALVTLAPRLREVVLLHDLDGWSHREIADNMGISEVMSRQLLFTARQTLRGLLAGLKPGSIQ